MQSATNNTSVNRSQGQVAALISNIDWGNTELGQKASWPEGLLNTLDLMLKSSIPMFLFWGKDDYFFYNDAFYKHLVNLANPSNFLGEAAEAIWPLQWPAIKPLVNSLKNGNEIGFAPIGRELFSLENDEFDRSLNYSIIKNNGIADGVLAICSKSVSSAYGIKTQENDLFQLELAIDACDLGTWDLDPQTMQFSCNDKTREIFGLGNQENINLSDAMAVIHPDDKIKVQNAIALALENKEDGRYDIEYSIVHPLSFAIRLVKVKGKAYFDLQNSPVRFAGIIQDITRETLVSRRKEKLQQLVEHSTDFMSMATLDGFITYINPSGRHLVGLTANEDVGHLKIRDFYSKEGFELIQQEVLPSLDTSGQWSGLVSIRHLKNNEEIPCYGNYLLIRDPQTGKIISRGLTLRDLRPDLKARKELEESEKRFRNLVQEAPVATAIYIGREMRIQWANDAMIRLWGKNKTVIGKTIREALPELEDQPFHGQLDDVFTTGKMYLATEDKGELVVDGKLQTYYFNFSYKPLHDSEGNIYGILNMAIDVTEMVKNKRRLEESENAFRNLIMQAPVGICLLKGNDFIIDVVNEQYLHLVGRKREGFVNKPIWKVIPEAKEQGYDVLLDNVRKSGKPYFGNEHSVQLMREGKTETVYLNFVYEPLFNESGEVHSILVIAIDISQQVRLRQQIENAEERARLAVDSGNFGTYEVNLQNGIVMGSDRFNELFDVDANSPQNDYVSRIHPADLLIRKEAHERALITGLLEYECRINHRNGDQIWIHVHGQVYYDDHRNPYKIIGIVQDVTSRKNIEQELERRVKERTAELLRLNEELQQFTYISSHDLREPLRKIQVFGSLAKEHADKANLKLNASLDKVVHSASRMSSLLTDLISYSTLSDHRRSMVRVDLNKVLQHALDDSELLIKEKMAIVKSAELPVVDGIEFQLTRLFFNLVQNAIKFHKADQPPAITIECRLLKNEEKEQFLLPLNQAWYRIDFIDNGIGFLQELSEKIFIVFQRLHDRNEYKGNGIGLALCKKVVENHHGKIFATSKPGMGARFTVLLPEYQNRD